MAHQIFFGPKECEDISLDEKMTLITSFYQINVTSISSGYLTELLLSYSIFCNIETSCCAFQKRRRNTTSDLELHEEVIAVVEIAKENYLVIIP